MYRKQIAFLENMGFINVSLYEDIGPAYFDAYTPSGKRAEIAIFEDKQIKFRELGVYPERWEEAGLYIETVAVEKTAEQKEVVEFVEEEVPEDKVFQVAWNYEYEEIQN